MSDKPRSPDEHEQSGTGAPRSPDDGAPQAGAGSDAPADPAVTSGMRSTSQPAAADEVTINRSGSGGSGGPVDADPSVEGSTGQSMAELLGGEDQSGPPGS